MSDNIKKGGISVETEHIFPIIKKWLYSEKEIFLREIVSNACDAVTKLRRLSSLGQVHDIPDDFKVTVKADKEAKTITVSDNGIGMTRDELEKYLCSIALSGALDFIQKYEGESEDAGNGIIGHFGLGFYSSFMVSDTVDVITRSYTGEPATKWVCSEAGEYTIEENYEKEGRGTDVVMHIAEGETEFLEDAKLMEILEKYCAFMPVEIYYEGEKKDDDDGDECECGHHHDEDHECECEHEHDEDHECTCKHDHTPKPINDTHPLWLKNPSECTDEEYKEFYAKVFRDYREPLFWIHINADYPLNFKGILYFPRLNSEFEPLDGQVKLYYNQVFVADNIKEVIPEYLLMLKGVLDCPELPLNVSRSYLQNSGYVAKISAHITKKVSDKLNSLFNTDRAGFEKLWKDIKLFVEYGCLRDKKFYERVKSSLLLKLTDGYKTVDEYLEGAKEKHENTVYYCSDVAAQAQYLSMFANEGIEVAVIDKILDNQFITMLEQDRGIKFLRVDADIADALKGDGEVLNSEKLTGIFKEISGNDKLEVKFENLKDAETPAILNISEQNRRFDDMMKMYRMSGEDGGIADLPIQMTVILNSSSSLIQKMVGKAEEDDEAVKETAKQVYTLALLAQRQLTAEELKAFLKDSFRTLEKTL